MHYHLPNVELLLARNIDAKRLLLCCFAEMHSAAAKKSTFFVLTIDFGHSLRANKKSESKIRGIYLAT